MVPHYTHCSTYLIHRIQLVMAGGHLRRRSSWLVVTSDDGPHDFFTLQPLKRWILFVKFIETKGFFSFWNHHKCLSQSFWFIWIPMLWVYSHYKYAYSYSAGSDFSRQNLTSTDVRFWRLESVPALSVTLSRFWPTSFGELQLLSCRARLEHMSSHVGRCLLMSPVLVMELREF